MRESPDSKQVPLISVGMPVYNGERFVAESIESVLAQTEGGFELIIADNASTDGTEAICRDYAARDPRIRYVRNDSNIGAAGNYNKLVQLARAEYFRWSNADDLLAPTLHEQCLATLRAHPEAVLAYGKTVLIDSKGETIEPYEDDLDINDPQPSERLRRFWEQVGMTNAIYGLMRPAAVRRTHVFGDGTLPAADTAFMAELIMHGGFVEIQAPLFFRRMHEGTTILARTDRARENRFWTGTGSDARFRMPVLRQNLRYLKRIWRLDASIGEKMRLTGYIVRRLVWARTAVASELVAAVRNS